MAEVFYFHVQEDRSIKYKLTEPIMQEDKDVAVWRFRIPKALNNIDMSAWAWWFVYVNAKNQKFSELLTLTNDIDDPDNYCMADYPIGYGISKTPGGFTFALEAINTSQGGEISGEWHTRTYTHTVTPTLQGNQAEYAETESDIISALIVEVQNKYNTLVGGATPLPVNLKSLMTDPQKVYLYTGSETGESTGYWYYWNGTQFVPGGLYGAGIQIDPTLSQSGQAADAKAAGDKIGELKSAFSNLDERNFSDFAPIVGNLKNELLSYVNGGIPEQYIGANIAYTDEKYYLVSDFSNVTVPSGLRIVLAFYSDTDPTYFVTGLEKTADFTLADYRYKYFRYCIRKVGSGTITYAEAKAVTLLMFNRYYADAVKAQGTAEAYNSFLTTGVGFLANTLKVGRITSTGITEGTRSGRYFDAYIPTKSIHSIEVPDGYAVNIYYYDANKVYAAASTSFVDFAPNTSYMYCRVNLVKYNSAHDQILEFNDDVSAFADFKVNIVKGNMTDFGDLLPNLASALTSNGITYTFENGKYYIKGTASAFSYAFLFNDENALPYGIVPGKRYFFEFEGLPSRINATIYHATSDGWVNAEAQRLIPTYYYGGYFDVPSDAVGLRISLSVNSGFTVDHVTEAHIYSVDSLEYAERVKQKATSPMLSIVYDDGLTKFKDYILPIIEAKKVPIATSIIVSAVEAGNPNVMTYADIKECYEKGAEVLVHSKERTEEEWGTSVSDVAYELRTAKHLLNSKVAHVPNCYIYSAQSGSYPVCRYAVQSEFMSAFNSGSQGSVSANNGVTNYRGAIDPYNIKRRWADANWLSGETDAETILKGWINELVANGNGWQVWTRHNYGDAVEPTYATTLSNVIDYALSKGVRIVTVERGLAEYVY